MIIEYGIKSQASEKQCPRANFFLRVGSAWCSKCKYNRVTRNDPFGCGYVDCTCPDDKKFEVLPE